MSRGKPIFKHNDIKRAFDAASKSPVPVRSIDFTDREGRKLSFNIGDAHAAPTPQPNEWDESKNDAA